MAVLKNTYCFFADFCVDYCYNSVHYGIFEITVKFSVTIDDLEEWASLSPCFSVVFTVVASNVLTMHFVMNLTKFIALAFALFEETTTFDTNGTFTSETLYRVAPRLFSLENVIAVEAHYQI